MKYKEGDKVLIKSIDWYNENKNDIGEIDFKIDALHSTFIEAMSQFCGQILTIVSVSKEGTYHMKEDDEWFCWGDEMIEKLVSDANDRPYGFWLKRDSSNKLHLFKGYIPYTDELWFIGEDYIYLGEMPKSLFPEITSESSPQMIEFKLL